MKPGNLTSTPEFFSRSRRSRKRLVPKEWWVIGILGGVRILEGRVFSLNTYISLDRIALCWRGCPVHFTILSSVLAFYPLDTNNTSQLGQQRMPLDVVKYLLGRGGKIILFGNQCAREEIKKNKLHIFYSYHQGQI